MTSDLSIAAIRTVDCPNAYDCSGCNCYPYRIVDLDYWQYRRGVPTWTMIRGRLTGLSLNQIHRQHSPRGGRII